MENYETLKVENVELLKRKTVYFFLKQQGFSEHYIKSLRTSKDAVILNDYPVGMRHTIENGDTLKINKNPKQPNFTDECDGDLDILFENDDYLVINKPHNLACIPTRSHFSHNLGGMIMKYMHSTNPSFVLRIINRLDKETAGIIIVAKNVQAYNRIGKVDKTYYALCEGKIEKPYTIDKNIKTETENGINKPKRIVSEDGKRAITNVFPEKYFKDYSLVSLKLETGRTHQIRVHLSSENHPLLGDTLYSTNNISNHAFLLLKEVSFNDYKTGKTLHFSCNYPQDWTKYLEK